jgi:hypothetical protein
MYFQKYLAGATRATGAAQFSATFANGLLVPRTIVLPHQGTASAQAEIATFKNAAVAPVVFNEADTLPATVYPQVAAAWTLGPVKLNAVTVDGVENVSIEPGVGLVTDGRDSDIYPTLAAVGEISPSVTLRGAHIDITSTLTEDGAYYTAAQVKIWARKKAEGGTFVVDGTPEHVLFTLGKCRVEPIGIAGNPKGIDLRLTPWYTAGGSPVSPITVNTAIAIT